LEHIKNHTYLTIRTLSWDKGGRDPNAVIHGDELNRMETWLAKVIGESLCCCIDYFDGVIPYARKIVIIDKMTH
jgi:hypothetical protein